MLLLAFYCQLSLAQLFPVQANPQLVPPHSLKLSDYATTTSEKLLLNLLLTDVNEADLQVRLRFSIEGDRGDIRSTDFVQDAAPIRLTGGVPLRLSNLDLRPYFDLRNLQGITRQQYNTPLPDGLYQFCFEVFDWVTGQQLSQKRCIPVYLILNDPPFLNLPQRGELVTARDPQNIIFQWTPRHLNATGVQYEFELRELWDTQINPQAAFLASPTLYRTTTFATTLLYGPGETTLLNGKIYGWRVRALVSDGISETSIFKNNGYSEIFHFTNTGQCEAPRFVLAKSQGTTTEEITWQQNPNHIQYQVQYRKKGSSGSIWFEQETAGTTKKLFFLEPDTTYEFRVGGQCIPNGGYSFSQINTFTTPSREEASNYNCGIPPEILITNQKPIEQLGVNDVFTAGDFPVTIQEVYGSNGTFSGWGFIVVPYLADTQIRVGFENIRINTDLQLIIGVVETVYNPDFATTEGSEGMDDIGNELETIAAMPQELVALAEAIEKEIDAIVQSVKDGIDADTVIEMWQEVLDDTDNNLTDGQRTFIENGISNKEMVKQGITDLRKSIEKDGLTDEQFNQYYVSNFADKSNTEEDISDVVDINALIAFIKRNIEAKNKMADYKKEDFYVRNILLEDYKMDYVTPNGSTIGLYVNLNKGGKIDLALADNGTYKGVNLFIDPDDLFHTGFYLKFGYSQNSNEAIEIWTKSFEEYEELLRLFGFDFDEAYAISIYDEAINDADDDCDDLDVIYETIPLRVAEKLGDQQLYKDLKLLTDCNVFAPNRLYSGTNENLAVINILNAFDTDYIYGKINAEPDYFRMLFDKLDYKYVSSYVKVLVKIGIANWSADEIEKSLPFLLEPFEFYDPLYGEKNVVSGSVIGYCFLREGGNDYDLGYETSSYRTDGGISMWEGSRQKILGIIGAFSPIHTKWNGEDILIPAMAAGYFTEEKVAETHSIALNNIFAVLLPEFTGLSLNSLNWLDDVGRAGDDLLSNVFGKSRQYIRDTYPNGQKILNILKLKFGNNQGAASVLVQRFGDDGLKILNKSNVNQIDDAASELIKGKILYRHIDENASYLSSLKKTGEIPSGYTTYMTLDKFEDAAIASSKMQLPPENNAVWRLEFDGNQLIDKIEFPKGKFNNTEYKEVITRSFPEWGQGGATQFITKSNFKITKMTNLKTGQEIIFK